MIYALIPARGGSKRIPRKNLQRIGSHSLVELAIRAAKGASRIGEIWVSSEDSEIGLQALSAGALWMRRSRRLAQDETTMEAVVHDFATWLPVGDNDIVVLLEPTAPLRLSSDINAVVTLLEFIGSQAIRLVAPTGGAGCHSATYRDSGIACAFRGRVARGGCLFPDGTVLIHHGADRAIDVDGPEDLERARAAVDA